MNSGYNFTARVRNVLALAREEASALHHQYVGVEHLLLAMLREGEGVGCAVLQAVGLDLTELRDDVMQMINVRTHDEHTGPDLPYTSRAKKVLELSMAEARELNHSYVGTDHLILGLIREERGIAAQVLTQHGLSLSRAREEVLRILGDADAVMPAPLRMRKPITSVLIEVRYADGSVEQKEFASAVQAATFLGLR